MITSSDLTACSLLIIVMLNSSLVSSMRILNQTIYSNILPRLLMKQNMSLFSKYKKKHEKYVYDIAAALSNVTRSEEKLQLSLVYLEINKNITSISYNFTKEQLIEYAIEGFIVRNASVFDRVLQLINTVLELKVYRKNINFVSINSRIRKQYPAISLALKNVKKVTSKYLNHRNKVIHESAYSDAELVRMQLISDHINTDLQRGVSPEFDLVKLNENLNTYIENKVIEFREHIKNVEVAIDEITNLLEPIFKDKFSHISNHKHNK
ncbi:Cthe_2314 family HEPN domain-containing protein [Vibrio cholerae]|uniref:Cthe_2314 family HEPN domain-containing protein n=1 Tax=Vibrio cholerae TaxID=666 RepID=UPI00111BD3C1|nr:Cthe_2314 family HEPN domain-containing protein [Vibrio cholerae]